jgi:DNA polymerase IV
VAPLVCRDCLISGQGAARCPHCGSPRILAHPEHDSLGIAHIDCDAFFAAIEKRDDPSLADKPVIVGGGRRGVVATACYVARTYGIRSAMPMFKALKACPDAVVIRPDIDKYARVGREVRRLMLELTPLVEPVSIDEAYLDLTATESLHRMSPAQSLARLVQRIEQEIGVTASIGLSYGKGLAKLATEPRQATEL